AWTRLRHEAPVARCEVEHFPPFWAITKHEDIIRVATDPVHFLNAPLISIFKDNREAPPETRLRHLLNMDPPEHRAYRRLAAKNFTPRSVRPRLEVYEGLVDEILEQVRDKDEIDWVTEFAALLPIWVIADMLGIPREDRELFFNWTNEIVGSADRDFRREGMTARQTTDAAVAEQIAYFGEMVGERRRCPMDDITSVLANAELDGAPLPENELFSYLLLLIVAGNETTRNAASGGLLAFTDNPEEWRKLRDDPSLVDAAVEEIVRWTTPVIQFARTATEDCELRGRQIKAGDHLCLFYPSANRDEDVFDEPFAFRADRNPNPHLAFGIGEHLCLGAHLARNELKAILNRLLHHGVVAERTGEVERLHSSFIGGIKRLPVRLHFGR
ncbi:MAG: cytochrome P450, partial [Thermoanaerobaculia bacterium]|nr:cytochrome P450 [Thermoanaerobaculia bacterium]